MKTFSHILAFDPSGNFEEGKGTTGVCLFDSENNKILNVLNISAIEFNNKEAYWQAHLDLINKTKLQLNIKNLIVIIEDFMLDPRRALQQSHSHMETPKLIGIIQLYCKTHNIPYAMQRPIDVKIRWTDKILEYKKYIIKNNRYYVLPETNKSISRHCKDAIRHAVHYHTFKNKEIKEK